MSMIIRAFSPVVNKFYQDRRPIIKGANLSTRNGIFLTGDLAGQPVIKTSIRDGYQTTRSVSAWLSKRDATQECDADIAIIGAGASGLAAALEAKRLGLRAIVLEKKRLANTISDFPVGKKIYAQPEDLEIDSDLWLENCIKEDLLERWKEIVKSKELDVRLNKDLVAIEDAGECFSVKTNDGEALSCRAVILAIGRRGNPRKLGVDGEELEHVQHALLDPRGYKGKRVLVVGGGNSAVEAACAMAGNGAEVTVSYRSNSFYRASKSNQEAIHEYEKQGSISIEYESKVERIEQGRVDLLSSGSKRQIDADHVFILIGAEAPTTLLNRLGVAVEHTWGLKRFFGLIASIVVVYLVYAASKWYGPGDIKAWPLTLIGDGNPPWWFSGGIAKGILYSLLVGIFGIAAMRRWRAYGRVKAYQTWRYISIMFCQIALLFLIPEFLLKLLDPQNYWRFYGVVMPFPLIHKIFFGAPGTFWGIACAISAFIVFPIFIYWHGKRFCSWVCGCGCLADTLGDRVRHYAPQGDLSRRIEAPLMWVVLIWAFMSAGFYLMQSGGQGAEPWHVASYDYVIDFWFASVFGVALYFFFGSRIWCRYLCPLAHMMKLLSALYSKFRIKPADRCIACGDCARYCQMGIDVMRFALKDEQVDNRNSSCIGCGICVSVCPMDNLTMGDEFPNQEKEKSTH